MFPSRQSFKAIMVLVAIGAMFVATTTTHAAEHALLIGIGDYQAKQIGGQDPDLEGPIFDVIAIKEELIKLGVPAENVKMLTNQEATRSGILGELVGLTKRTRLGDKIFIYFSGHGTSAHTGERFPMPYTSGALIPYDFQESDGDSEVTLLGKMIVGRNDLKPIFQKLDEGRQVLVVFDSCYSGNTVRSLGQSMPSRYLPINLPSRGGGAMADLGDTTVRANDLPAEPYPYHNLFYMGASAEYELAFDISTRELNKHPTVDGKPHGAFTDALLRFLQGKLDADGNRDGRVTNEETARALAKAVHGRFAGQNPQSLPKGSDLGREVRDVAFFLKVPNSSSQPPSPTLGPLQVQLENVGQKVRQKLENLPEVKITNGNGDLLVVKEGEELFILFPNRQPMARYIVGQEEELANRLKNHVRTRALADAPSTVGASHVSLEFKGVRQGGKMVEGERFGFMVRSDATVYLLMLEIDPHGAISVLYPFNKGELAPLPGGTSKSLADALEVRAPWGTDFIKLFAFQEKPSLLVKLLGQGTLKPDSNLYREIECLVGVAPGCQATGMAQDRLSIVSYPRHELSQVKH